MIGFIFAEGISYICFESTSARIFILIQNEIEEAKKIRQLYLIFYES